MADRAIISPHSVQQSYYPCSKNPEMSRRQFNDLADIWLNSMPKEHFCRFILAHFVELWKVQLWDGYVRLTLLFLLSLFIFVVEFTTRADSQRVVTLVTDKLIQKRQWFTLGLESNCIRGSGRDYLRILLTIILQILITKQTFWRESPLPSKACTFP